ncbi:MAG: tetratricopeptide repeat protein [Bacteroidetes bacterium]|nr:tetratricopeptide repeat protein [Bacteroidota bacterium]
MKTSRKSTFNFLIISSLLFLFFSCNEAENKKISDKQSTEIEPTDSLKIENLSNKIRETPKDDNLFYERSKLYFTKGDIANATNDLEIAIKLDSLKAKYYTQLSEYQLLKGDSKASKTSLEKCIKLFPNNTDALLKLSNIYLYVKEYKNSFKYLSKVERIDKHIAQTYFIKGLIYKELNKPDDAIKNLQIAVDNEPNYYEAYMLLGLLYAEKNDSIAIDYYKNAIKIIPNSVEAHYNTAFFYQKNKKYKKAIDKYNYFLDNIDSTQQAVYYNIGYIYLIYLNEYKKAISYFSKAINYDSKYFQAYYNRGYCYELLKQYGKAKKEYQKSLEIYPNYELSINALNRLDKVKK